MDDDKKGAAILAFTGFCFVLVGLAAFAKGYGIGSWIPLLLGGTGFVVGLYELLKG
ncbi:MAG TPA: hypothetical protein VL944_02175 [Candidatus Acidoferrum sp.]|nr:hypothetical protein [Candidatus Acidoferrum sp.]